MMPEMDGIQSAQDSEYDFPYHYIAQRTGLGVRVAHSWRWGFRYIAALEYLLDRMRAIPFQSVVDVGCGDGRFVAEIARTFGDIEALGIDYSRRAIAVAKAMNPPGNYRCMDITGETLGQTFDLLTSIEVLEHVPPASVPEFVAGMRKLARADSRLLLTVPHVNQRLARKHYQHFDAATLAAALSPHFRIASLGYIDRKSRFVDQLERALVNKHFIVANEPLLGALLDLYKRHGFAAAPNTGMRMVALCEAI